MMGLSKEAIMTRKTNQQQWAERLLAQQASGNSVAAFCREHELSESTFGYWTRKLRGNKEAEDLPVPVVSSRFSRVDFVHSPQPTGVTLRFRGGVVLESSLGYPDPLWLRAVVSGLVAEGL